MSLLLRSNPFFFNRMMDFFHDDFMTAPSYITPTETGYVMELPIPGMTKQDVKIHLEDRTLYVQAKTNKKTYSNYQYVQTLPRDAEVESMTASVDHGLLVISINKNLKKTLKEIPIQ